jgi:hypothetical protein
MSETTQLRPCPFCGHDAIKPARRHGFPVQAECLNCGAEGPSKLTAREADQAWNGLQEWSPDAPNEEGPFWFYGAVNFGSMGGHYSGQIQPSKEIHLVRIRKISNGLMAVADGRFMSLKPFDKEKKQEGRHAARKACVGRWQIFRLWLQSAGTSPGGLTIDSRRGKRRRKAA